MVHNVLYTKDYYKRPLAAILDVLLSLIELSLCEIHKKFDGWEWKLNWPR